MSSVVKMGTWGGDQGLPCDITVAPQRLETISLRWGKVIDWIAFSYRDRTGNLHTAGPWGGNGKGEGTETITLEPSEYVREVAWSEGPFTFKNVERCITSIKFVTNLRSFGPFGHGVDSTHHSLPVLSSGSVVGLFARAGDFLDAIGFYVLPGGGAQHTDSSSNHQNIEKQEEEEEEDSNNHHQGQDGSKENGKEDSIENGKNEVDSSQKENKEDKS